MSNLRTARSDRKIRKLFTTSLQTHHFSWHGRSFIQRWLWIPMLFLLEVKKAIFSSSQSEKKNNLSGSKEILVNRGNWHLEKKKNYSMYNFLEALYSFPNTVTRSSCAERWYLGNLMDNIQSLVALCRPTSACCRIVRVGFRSTL